MAKKRRRPKGLPIPGLTQKRSKYKVAPKHERTVDGIVFDSKLEMQRYLFLSRMANTGIIKSLELQPTFECRVNDKLVCKYIADFRYVDVSTGVTVVEDAKGVSTAIFKLKKKLVEALYPDVKIKIVKANGVEKL